jgi:hypothetical protein
MPFLPGTPLEPAVIPTAHASSFTLQYFPYYVWCSKYSCLLWWTYRMLSWYTVFACIICTLFLYFGRWKITRKICGFFFFFFQSGFYSNIIENTVLLSIFYCNFVTILIYQ